MILVAARQVRLEPFSADVWRKADLTNTNARTRMLGSLTDRMRQQRWTAGRIVAELGPPPWARPYPAPAGSVFAGRHVWVDPLGPILRKNETWSLLVDPAQEDDPALWTMTDDGSVRYHERPPAAPSAAAVRSVR